MRVRAIKTGNKQKLTADEHKMFKRFVDDNMGYRATGAKISLHERTIKNIYESGVCHPELTYPVLTKKIFKQVAA